MGKMSGLIAAALLLSTTGCVEAMNSGYPATSYGYGAPAYYGNTYSNRSYYSNGYYSQPSSYYRPYPVTNNYYTTYTPAPRPTVVTQTRYVPVPVSTPPRPVHDRDHDGGSRHRGQDKNGDGVPDRWQRH